MSRYLETTDRSAQVGLDPLTDFEIIAARLYTGPMFEKYNGVLRGVNMPSVPFFASQLEKCRGNRYVDSIHCINLCLLKLAKVMKAAHRVLEGHP